MAFYLDTSALVKLVVAEPETAALRLWIERADQDLVTSDLARTELMRVARQVAPDRVLLAREVLESASIVEVATAVFEEAGRLHPADLRSLDAIHLAAALDLGDDLAGLVTYDKRLAEGASANGIEPIAPH